LFNRVTFISILSGSSEVHTSSVRARAYKWRHFKRSEHAIIQDVKEVVLFAVLQKKGGALTC
jgi:hypothetical protein